MKKIVSLVLVLMMCLSLCGFANSKSATECEKLINAIGEVSVDSKEAIETAEKAYEALTEKEKESIAESAVILNDARSAYIFELSKLAYQNINSAYDITHKFGADVYEAWLIGATNPMAIQKMGVAYLANCVSLTEDEIKGGLGYFQAYIDHKNWDDLTEAEKKQYVDNGDAFLKGVSNSNVLQTSIYTIPFAYIVNGKTEEAQATLNNAKNMMRELSKNYSDYEHYPNLKEYYTTVNAYFNFCQMPKGTFTMVETTINEYMNDIRDFRSDLDFIFGE